MKEQLFRFLAVAAFFGVIGTIGGLEHHMFGFGRCILQSGFFLLLAIFCSEQADAAHRATRRRRKATKQIHTKEGKQNNGIITL